MGGSAYRPNTYRNTVHERRGRNERAKAMTSTPRALSEAHSAAGSETSTRDEAVARAERIRTGIESMAALQDDIAAAYHRRDWTTLGYDSWDGYVSGEFGEQ